MTFLRFTNFLPFFIAKATEQSEKKREFCPRLNEGKKTCKRFRLKRRVLSFSLDRLLPRIANRTASQWSNARQI